MRRTLKISGSSKGFYLQVVGKSLYASGSIGKRMDGSVGLAWSGTFLPSPSERAKVEAVIAEVMASGVEQVITIGDAPKPEARVAEWRSSRGLTLTEEMDREDTTY